MTGFRRLEAILLDSEAARRHFVDYFHHHTEIQFAIRAGRAADAVLDQLSLPTGPAHSSVAGRAVGGSHEFGRAGGSGSRPVLSSWRRSSPRLRMGGLIGPLPWGDRGRAQGIARSISPGWSTPRTAGGRARTRSQAATCGPASSCGWNEGWPRSSSTGVRG